jgi:membrane-associated protein
MEPLIDFILNLDKHLGQVVREYREWTYAVVFLTVLLETGLVILFVLPGDEVVFAAAFLSTRVDSLDIRVLVPLFIAASFCGDQISYLLGRTLGRKPFETRGRFFNPKSLHRAEAFYKSHGAQAILFGRFVPFVRGVMPFSAALARMPYPRFAACSLAGATLWTLIQSMLGYGFGKLPFVRSHFGWAVFGIILVAVTPATVEILWTRRKKRSKKK